MFGEDEFSLKNENKIFLYTGIIDTTDEHSPIASAVIKIDSNEIILNRTKYNMDKDKVNEEYSGGGYSLLLSYIKKIDQNGEPVYEGKLTLKNKNINEAYNIIGYTCNL